MSDYKVDDTVDITDVVCPVTFVKAKVALEELEETMRELFFQPSMLSGYHAPPST